MIRIMVVLWSVLATGVGVSLFLLKHEVQSLEDDLDRINRAVRVGEESIHVLQAEWSFLNDPTRLRRLAENHLHMAPVTTSQISTIANLPTGVLVTANGASNKFSRPIVSSATTRRVVQTAPLSQLTAIPTVAVAMQRVAPPAPPPRPEEQPIRSKRSGNLTQTASAR